MKIENRAGAVFVSLTWGDPVYTDLKEAGFRWDRIRKCWYRKNDPETQRLLAGLQAESEQWEKAEAARRRNGFPIRHRRTFDCKEEIKRLGGRWDPDGKVWVLPDQASYDQAWAFCESGAVSEVSEIEEIILFTSIPTPPVEKDGIIAKGTPDRPRFLRAIETPKSHVRLHPGSARYTDHFTGQPIAEGYSWQCKFIEVSGTERNWLLQ